MVDSKRLSSQQATHHCLSFSQLHSSCVGYGPPSLVLKYKRNRSRVEFNRMQTSRNGSIKAMDSRS